MRQDLVSNLIHFEAVVSFLLDLAVGLASFSMTSPFVVYERSVFPFVLVNYSLQVTVWQLKCSYWYLYKLLGAIRGRE